MDIKYKFIRQSRIVKETFDTKTALIAARTTSDNNVPNTADVADEDMPIYYIVKVQVKIAFFWITIWKKQCDISDGDSRQHIINQAAKIQTTLAEL